MDYSVLIVEDHPHIQRLFQRGFAHAGFHVLEPAWNGAEALQRLAEQRPDIVILDIDMPVMDGFAVLRSLKEDRHLRSIKVIIATARPEFAVSVEARLADLFLLKPVRINDMVQMALRLVSAAPTRSGEATGVEFHATSRAK